jgi:hypothetical protein
MNIEKPSTLTPEEKEQLVKDLAWFKKVSADLGSLDPRKQEHGRDEKRKNAILFNRMATRYGMELTPEELQKVA